MQSPAQRDQSENPPLAQNCFAQREDRGDYYRRRRYLSLPRMITHWAQVDAVSNCCQPPAKVLEIGPGDGHVSWLLRRWGYQLTTCDVEPDVTPDVVGSVSDLPFDSDTFDLVMAAQVLEHLPFEQFGTCLRELGRVARTWVIVSVPAPLIGLAALLNVPKADPLGVAVGVPLLRSLKPGGEHHWELGRPGYGKRRIRSAFGEVGLTITREFRPPGSLFCYFFVARTIDLAGSEEDSGAREPEAGH